MLLDQRRAVALDATPIRKLRPAAVLLAVGLSACSPSSEEAAERRRGGGSGRQFRLRRLGSVPRRRRFLAVLVAGANRQEQRRPAGSRVDVSDGRELLVQSAGRRQHDVRAREGPLDRRARRRDGPRALGARERRRRRHARHELLAQRRRQRGAPALHQRRAPHRDRRQDRRDDPNVRRRWPRRPARRARWRHRRRFARCKPTTRAEFSRTSSSCRYRPAAAATRRRRRTSTPTTCAPACCVDLPHRAAARRVRCRHVARRRGRQLRRRAQLERIHGRLRARHHLRPYRHRALRLLRREPPWRKPVR